MTLGVARERLVVAEGVWLVLPVPAGAAEILETLQVSTEVGARLEVTQGADGILQVGVNLNL